MLRIGCPDRHALLRITPHETPCPVTAAPSRASGFVLRRKGVVQQAAAPGRLPAGQRPGNTPFGLDRSARRRQTPRDG